MASTNSTEKELNKFEDDRGGQYSKWIMTVTGNGKDTDCKISGNKIVSGKIFNQTYTLLYDKQAKIYEEVGHLLDWYSPIDVVSQNRIIYGHPDKFIYDYEQQYNNCGVVTVLNILSMAGKVDIVDPTEEMVAELTKPVTVKVKNKYHDAEYVQVTPNVETSSSEQDITLFAIRNDYCDHSREIPTYKTAEDIQLEDGATKYNETYQEQHMYHNTIASTLQLLNDYGVPASVQQFQNPVLVQTTGTRKVYQLTNEGDKYKAKVAQKNEDGTYKRDDKGAIQYEIVDKQDPITKTYVVYTDQSISASDSTDDSEKYKDHTPRYAEASMDVEIENSQYGLSDTLEFSDLSLDEFITNTQIFDANLGQHTTYALGKDGRDLIIRYTPTCSVRIKNYYPPQVKTETDDTSKIKYIKFAKKLGEKYLYTNNVQDSWGSNGTVGYKLETGTKDEFGRDTYINLKKAEGSSNVSWFTTSGNTDDESGLIFYQKYKNGIAQNEENDYTIKEAGKDASGNTLYAGYEIVTEARKSEDGIIVFTDTQDGNQKNLYIKYEKEDQAETMTYLLAKVNNTSGNSQTNNTSTNTVSTYLRYKDGEIDTSDKGGTIEYDSTLKCYVRRIVTGSSNIGDWDNGKYYITESGEDSIYYKNLLTPNDGDNYVFYIQEDGSTYIKYVNFEATTETIEISSHGTDITTGKTLYYLGGNPESTRFYEMGSINGRSIFTSDNTVTVELDKNGIAKKYYYVTVPGSDNLVYTTNPQGDIEKDNDENVIKYEQIGKDENGNYIYIYKSEGDSNPSNLVTVKNDEGNNVYYYEAGKDLSDNMLFTANPDGDVIKDGENIIYYEKVDIDKNENNIYTNRYTLDGDGNKVYIEGTEKTEIELSHGEIVRYYLRKDSNYTTNPDGYAKTESGYTIYYSYDESEGKYLQHINDEDGNPTSATQEIVDPSVLAENMTRAYDNFNIRSEFVDDMYDVIGQIGMYSGDIVKTNNHTYGKFIEELAQYVKEGRALSISGQAEALRGGSEEGSINHAIALVGIAYTTKKSSENGVLDVSDIDGFYVVDSGNFIGKTGSAQFISCETLYNYLTATSYNTSEIYSKEQYFSDSSIQFVATDDEVRSWADELNMTGNGSRNTLIGNNSKNILRGGAGTDNLYGQGGNDILYGDSDGDWLYGNTGNDTLYGGSGNDTYVFTLEDVASVKYEEDGHIYANPVLKEEAQCDIIIPGTGSDTLRFENWCIDDMEFKNVDGDLVIKYGKTYHFVKTLINPDTQETYEEETAIPSELGNNNSVIIKDYFKKGLSTSIGKVDDAVSIARKKQDNKDHSYSLLNIIKTHDIEYESNNAATQGNSQFNLTGTSYNDLIVTGKKNDIIKSAGGNDKITSGAGDDTIKAGAGDDEINLSFGNNKIYGESGVNDVYLVFKDGDQDKTATGFNTIYTGSGNDYIHLETVNIANVEYARIGNNLVVKYDDKGSSVTITNYFAKQGKTSAKMIYFKDNQKVDLYQKYNELAGLVPIVTNTVNDFDNVIKGTSQNDTITGGLGCDKMYGQGGSDRFVFQTTHDGADIIYTTGSNNQINLDFENVADLILKDDSTGFTGGYERYENGTKNYAFTKDKNDLIINYGLTLDEDSMSNIRISNYFNSSNRFTLNTATYDLDLKDAKIYFEGILGKANKITGSKQDDIMYGAELNDTLNAGIGNDTIYGGYGNDTITGGAGTNKIIYNFGDGVDTINLTKNENLKIYIKDTDDNSFNESQLGYRIEKGNLVISHADNDILILKNFGKSDITGIAGSVELYHNNTLLYELREELYLDAINDFSTNKKSATGTWHSERFDASGLLQPFNMKYNTGVSINGGAGDDIIIGSDYNDTLKGGNGSDLIVGGSGKNVIDGGNDADTYWLFNDNVANENSIIKDTGKTGNDTAIIYAARENLDVRMNISKNGYNYKGAIVIEDKLNNNTASLTNVETIQLENGTEYNVADVIRDVAQWLAMANNGLGYANVNTALSKGSGEEIDALIAIFDSGWTV